MQEGKQSASESTRSRGCQDDILLEALQEGGASDELRGADDEIRARLRPALQESERRDFCKSDASQEGDNYRLPTRPGACKMGKQIAAGEERLGARMRAEACSGFLFVQLPISKGLCATAL